MVSDSISDMLARIKNAYLARHRELKMPYSKLRENLGKLLLQERFLAGIKVKGEGKTKELIITLRYHRRTPALTDIKIVSKPSLRVYVSKNKIPRVLGGLGVSVMSTSKGLMTGSLAKKENLGGELLFKIW